jgi:hypothetical protein
MDSFCQQKTRMRDMTLSPYTSFNGLKKYTGVLFLISQEISDWCVARFHPSHESGRTTQRSHTQTKLRSKPTDTERGA